MLFFPLVVQVKEQIQKHKLWRKHSNLQLQQKYKSRLTDTDTVMYIEIIWNNEPILCGDFVKICESEMSWKKSTVYAELRELRNREIFNNSGSIATSKISKE